jgi:hypothetical protein
MPSLTAKDRVSPCLFSYEDGRRCRTPRISSHPQFCFYHARKESQSLSTEKLAKDLTYFFSGDYLSANDLNTALGRLIPAVIRGEIKPRVARTVAYMLQTLMQSTRQAQHEYINAFSTDDWRETIATSVTANHDYLYPPDPNAESNPDPENESEHDPEDEIEDDSADAPDPHHSSQAPIQSPVQPAPTPRPSPADTEAALAAARSLFPDRSPAPPAQSATNSTNPQSAQPSNTQPTAPIPGGPCFSRRRPHNPSTNSFGTNINTRPGNS